MANTARKKRVLNIIHLSAFQKKKHDELMSDMQQKWSHGDSELSDQYGFTILVGNGYKLLFRDEYLVTVYSIEAAKLISRIILNDMVDNMNTVKINSEPQPLTPCRVTDILKVL